MKIHEIIIMPSWSCYLCGNETEQPYWLDQKPFCNYKHGFKFVWHIIFGEVEHLSEYKMKGYANIGLFIKNPIIWQEGWNYEQIQAVYTHLFNLQPATRQNMAFQITKYFINSFSKEAPEYAQ